jgi:hypothetical protein
MRKLLVAGAVVAASAAVAGTAGAAPKNEPEIFDCGSGPVEIVTNGGPNGWIGDDGVKYRAVLIQVSDPAGNLVFVKARGNPRELSNPEALNCTSTDPDGFIIEVIAIPA